MGSMVVPEESKDAGSWFTPRRDVLEVTSREDILVVHLRGNPLGAMMSSRIALRDFGLAARKKGAKAKEA